MVMRREWDERSIVFEFKALRGSLAFEKETDKGIMGYGSTFLQNG